MHTPCYLPAPASFQCACLHLHIDTFRKIVKAKTGTQGEASSSSRVSQQGSSDILATSTLNKNQISRITYWHRKNPTNIGVPTSIKRAYTPPLGHMSFACFHCDAGVIPPLFDYYLKFLDRVGVALDQTASNTYHILVEMRRLFKFVFEKEPTMDEIFHLYQYKSVRNPSFYFLEANKHITLLLNL